mmetsp:Transcript_8098/g.14299  ORF Transcript_8098/g.14299 Transcript_8098/m.14299 type:complete len:102 (+) Transcript_8098:33-338(+)|eukprot:CAMPEP_0194559882 /NCGR_PEP_ID=MMETSP0292-20121207/1272_1 /TAXON_ID=39354 /ORGANISM="Heterosigma akashiwo, Strain CCMP2393" /LENGTH=101 /DNA_ID=CAMNT_0039407925 /DNA_START=12 /DNA_END=317 /DNA_ORIENTATION=+
MAERKDIARNDRLQWSNRADYHLQNELNSIALHKCKDKVEAFASCAKENGILVVFKCSHLNRAMNDCLNSYTNKEALEVYRVEREQSVPQRVVVVDDSSRA